MTEISVIPAAGGEAIQLGPVQMRILEDGRTTGHRLGVGELTIAARADGPPRHRHARHDEGFYVVSGTARFMTPDNVGAVMSRYATVPATDYTEEIP